ncbi:hypothetical protein FOQG_08620 [Fusarium oxysporum f. sp. raphani 54005]|uniref:Uncharacterized protein n=3 Tax=Fusarium oxysporum TaxID=5507 RepID=X0C1N2_FUSOX|nr:hypothetical protein FOVG_00944 [Fusarium oxysporum f. sp. pisi HDV247]EXK88315.1 hypothetical protein FOQG_08620 [Fusarium oxysporum f. sp. raphani 54005]EXL77214.1 hypothetical protein FOPG_08249 [Fusarium oxysporum f. sp. conglutinans race 2 54008]KAI8418577.1 hypothetical protein FOFC_01146 [Fusarium oxysporum]
MNRVDELLGMYEQNRLLLWDQGEDNLRLCTWTGQVAGNYSCGADTEASIRILDHAGDARLEATRSWQSMDRSCRVWQGTSARRRIMDGHDPPETGALYWPLFLGTVGDV